MIALASPACGSMTINPERRLQPLFVAGRLVGHCGGHMRPLEEMIEVAQHQHVAVEIDDLLELHQFEHQQLAEGVVPVPQSTLAGGRALQMLIDSQRRQPSPLQRLLASPQRSAA